MEVRILIVDDEQEICDAISRRLRFLNYQVDTAQNGHEALAYLGEKPFQVVVSDIIMPKMDGVELLRNVKNQYPMVHVIMITGYVTMENLLACMRHGADTCIFKPFEDTDELERAIANAVENLEHWEAKLKELRAMKPTQEET